MAARRRLVGGRLGIGQLTPDTVASCWCDAHRRARRSTRAMPEHNIRMSARYLRWLLDGTGGDVRTGPRRLLPGAPVGPGQRRVPVDVAYVDGVLSLRIRFLG